LILKSLCYRCHDPQELRGSLVVEGIKRGLAREGTLPGASISTNGILSLLKSLLSKSAGIILAAWLRLQSLLEAILSLGVVKTLSDVFAVRATRALNVLVLDVAGSSVDIGWLGLARLGVGVGAKAGRGLGSTASAGLAGAGLSCVGVIRLGLSRVGARSGRGLGVAASAGVLRCGWGLVLTADALVRSEFTALLHGLGSKRLGGDLAGALLLDRSVLSEVDLLAVSGILVLGRHDVCFLVLFERRGLVQCLLEDEVAEYAWIQISIEKGHWAQWYIAIW
jgi:hypothetical protein